MAHPFPSTTTELDLPHAETLTNSAADEVNTLLEQNSGNRLRIVEQRKAQERKIDAAKLEIASLDRIIHLLDKTAIQYLEQLNQPPAVLSLQVIEEPHEVTSTEHQATWDGFTPPETGVFASVPDLSPDPEKNLTTFDELHDAQDAREGVR